jgi:hypothetical protein
MILLLGVLMIRPQVSGIAYPFSQGFLLVPILIGLSLLFLSSKYWFHGVAKKTGVYLILPWLLFFWSITSLLWTPDPGQGVRECFALLFNLVIFSLAFYIAHDDAGLRKSAGTLLGLVTVPVLLRALYQRFFGLPRLREALQSMAESGEDISDLAGVISADRVFAGFLNSNMLAGFCAIIIPLTLDLALTAREGSRRLLFSLMLAAEGIVLILTGSLGGTLAAAAMAAAVLVVRKGAHRRFIVPGLGAMVLLVGLLILIRGTGFLTGPDSSLIQRAGYMAAGIRMALVHPFAGWGAGSSPGALMGFVAEGIRPVADPHNYLVRSWIAWGVPGLGVLLLWLVLWVRSVLLPVRKIGWQNCPEGYAGLVFGACAFLLHSLVDMDFFVPELAAFGWLIMGSALGWALTLTKDGQRTDPVEPGKGRYVAGGIALAMVLPSLMFLQGEFTAFRGGRAFQEKDYSRAAALFEDAGRILPYNGRFALDEGRAKVASDDVKAAGTLFDKADSLMRASPYPSWEMGRLAQARGDWAGSLLHLSVALDRYPTSPRIRMDQAVAYLTLGEPQQAYNLLREARRYAWFDSEARELADEALKAVGE